MAILNTPGNQFLARNVNREAQTDRFARAMYAAAFNDFWANPVVNAQSLDTNARATFAEVAAMAALIQAIDPTFKELPIPNKPGSTPPTPWVLTWNEDGSVTVS